MMETTITMEPSGVAVHLDPEEERAASLNTKLEDSVKWTQPDHRRVGRHPTFRTWKTTVSINNRHVIGYLDEDCSRIAVIGLAPACFALDHIRGQLTKMHHG